LGVEVNLVEDLSGQRYLTIGTSSVRSPSIGIGNTTQRVIHSQPSTVFPSRADIQEFGHVANRSASFDYVAEINGRPISISYDYADVQHLLQFVSDKARFELEVVTLAQPKLKAKGIKLSVRPTP
jgi:hypothetical protein